MVAKTARFFDLLRASEHAEEFLDENHRSVRRDLRDVRAKHAKLLGRMIAAAAAAGEISLAARGARPRSGRAAPRRAEGIKTRHRAILSSDAYRQRLGDAVRIVLAGFAPITPREAPPMTSASRAIPVAISRSESAPWPSSQGGAARAAEMEGRRRVDADVVGGGAPDDALDLGAGGPPRDEHDVQAGGGARTSTRSPSGSAIAASNAARRLAWRRRERRRVHLEVPAGDEVREARAGRSSPSRGRRRSSRSRTSARAPGHDEVPEPERRREDLREAADVEHAPARSSPCSVSMGAGVAILAVVVVLDDVRAGARAQARSAKRARERQDGAGRELVRRRHVGERGATRAAREPRDVDPLRVDADRHEPGRAASNAWRAPA
jgi:hypothetical protein